VNNEQFEKTETVVATLRQDIKGEEHMSDFTVSIDWDTAQNIVMRVLKKDLYCLRKDWDKRYEGKHDSLGVFSDSVQEDLEEISAHISAYKKIIKYYGGDVN
jgi:hypothetical protein